MDIIQIIILCFIATVVYYMYQDFVTDNVEYRMMLYRKKKLRRKQLEQQNQQQNQQNQQPNDGESKTG